MTRQFSKPNVCVLIPAYNEEKRIASVIQAAQKSGYPVVAVDDGSSDKTAETCRSLGAHCVVLPVNQGKGAALRHGFDWVLKNGYEGVIVVDADGQHDPKDLDAFMTALSQGDADVVIGNRMHNPRGMSLLRRCTNRLMSRIISSIAGQNVPDTQCGYRAFTREALKAMTLKTNRFEIESEMILYAGKKSLKIRSIPVASVYRDEISRIRPVRDTWRFFSFLARFLIFNK